MLFGLRWIPCFYSPSGNSLHQRRANCLRAHGFLKLQVWCCLVIEFCLNGFCNESKWIDFVLSACGDAGQNGFDRATITVEPRMPVGLQH